VQDLQRETDPIRIARQLINRAAPDVLLLLRFDYDAHFDALIALNNGLDSPYPYLFAMPPNSGMPTGLDLDGDGKIGEPRDAQGYGRFPGQAGMALLSRLPPRLAELQDFTPLLWRDLPGTLLPVVNGAPFPSPHAHAVQRLSSVAHWVLPLDTPHGPITLLAADPTPPLYDGPEDRNGRRNHDEAQLWNLLLQGTFGPPPLRPILLTEAGIDPDRDAHRPMALRALRNRLRDIGPPEPTTLWGDTPARSTLILADQSLRSLAHGHLAEARASRHALIWVDIEF